MEYVLERKSGVRRLSLQINGAGQLIVKAPKLLPKFLIDRFVNAQSDWVIKHQARRRQQLPAVTDHSVLIFGKTYPRIIHTGSLEEGIRLGTSIRSEQVVFASPHHTDTDSQAKAQKSLAAFLKSTAAAYLTTRVPELATQMGVTVPKIGLREQKTRWGSCNSHGTLHFNWRLVHFSPAVIDYVIVHELAHRLELNHSPAFWRIVARHDPDHAKHRHQLTKLTIFA